MARTVHPNVQFVLRSVLPDAPRLSSILVSLSRSRCRLCWPTLVDAVEPYTEPRITNR